jgi:hypothetical protein
VYGRSAEIVPEAGGLRGDGLRVEGGRLATTALKQGGGGACGVE